MTRSGWIALALATTAAILWLVTSLSTRGDRPAASDSTGVDEPELAPPAEPEPRADQPAQAAPPTAPAPAAEPEEQPDEPADPPSQEPPTSPLPPPEKSGPVDELKARFASEPRDSAAGTFEKKIEAAFRHDDVPAGLVKSVLCRRTVCRVETSWTPDRAIGFMTGFTRLLMTPPGADVPRPFDSNLGISPEGEPDASGVRAVDVYLVRVPPPEPER